MEFKEIATKRYATKKFSGEKLPKNKVNELLELIKLSASSFGLQPYKIIVVSDDNMKQKLLPLTYNQPQITTSSEVLVFCAYADVKKRIDQYEEMLQGKGKDYIQMMRDSLESQSTENIIAWAKNQTYIAIGNAINGAKALGFDSCPMEGFDPKGYSDALGLSDELVPVALVPIGIATDEQGAKLRYPDEELFIYK